jgi:hypothetical protein
VIDLRNTPDKGMYVWGPPGIVPATSKAIRSSLKRCFCFTNTIAGFGFDSVNGCEVFRGTFVLVAQFSLESSDIFELGFLSVGSEV